MTATLSTYRGKGRLVIRNNEQWQHVNARLGKLDHVFWKPFPTPHPLTFLSVFCNHRYGPFAKPSV